MAISLIIAAGGSSSRFRSHPEAERHQGKTGGHKLLYPLGGKPLLAHTIEKFQKIKKISETIVAAPPELSLALKSWNKRYGWKGVRVVRGGKTRAESVYRALEKTSRDNEWVMVHDGARPLVPDSAVSELLSAGNDEETQAIIVAKKIIPTVKESDAEGKYVTKTLNRDYLYEAETPQLVRRRILVDAYRSNKDAFQATDEAGLVEQAGYRVKLAAHMEWNPKVTHWNDFKMLEAVQFKSPKTETRVGIGRDFHRLVKGRKLYIGGVKIPSPVGALGHSDGDVLLHSTADAIWGVLAEGDIGEHFSDQKKKYKNIRSEIILKKALRDAEQKGWKPVHLDSVITLERPRLGIKKQMIRKKLAGLMNLKTDRVSIKAKTMEGLGPEGEGLAVSCEVLVTMEKTV